MPPFTPYLAIRSVGNSGLVQPGRVVGGNNFIPLGNPFPGLENTTLTTVNAQEQSRVVQFGDDLYLWQRNTIKQYDPITGNWGDGAGSTTQVYTVVNQDISNDYGFHTGLHFMHDKDGFPILIGLADHNSSSRTIRVKYGPDSFGVYGWTQLNLVNTTGLEDSNKGIAVYQNQLYRTVTSTVMLRYDPTTDLAIQQNMGVGEAAAFQDYTDMVVFQNRLFHIGQGNWNYITELVGGAWHHVRTVNTQNVSASPSIFEHNGNLYFIYGEISGSEDGWRLLKLVDLDTGSSVVLDSLIPANWRYNSGTERGAPGTPAPNWFDGTRTYVIVDQNEGPENPRLIVLFGSAAGAFNTMTAFEFIDEVTGLVEIPGGNLTGELSYPHNNFGSGAYHWTSGELNVQIVNMREISNTEQEIDFIAYGDPGNPNKLVRIMYDSNQELPITPATLISTNPTSGTTIMSDSFGDYIDGVDADGVTVYTVVRDFDADGASIGQQEVLMPHIERPAGT
jgi:hypothetical protein